MLVHVIRIYHDARSTKLKGKHVFNSYPSHRAVYNLWKTKLNKQTFNIRMDEVLKLQRILSKNFCSQWQKRRRDTQMDVTNCLGGARQRRMGLQPWLRNHKSCDRVLASSGGLQVHSQTMNTVDAAACSAGAYPYVRLYT